MLACLLGTVAPVFAEDDALETLGLVDKPKEEIVTPPRTPHPGSKIAENITVITAADIERLNAHTLADVLQTVPGIQLDYLRTPSTFTFFNINGATDTTVLVLVDGIRQNNYAQTNAAPGFIPVQQIERIEIIKGAASAAWGPALGGVVNIITKSPDPQRPISGMVSGSIGSSFTADSRAELSGTADRLGYYLTAGNLRSDGLTPNTATNMNNVMGKLIYTLPGRGTATLGLWHLTARPGMDEGVDPKWGFVHDNSEFRNTNGYLKLSQPLAGNLRLDIDGYLANSDYHTKWGGRDDQGAIVFYNDNQTREASRGVNSRLFWGDSEKNLTVGVDYGHVRSKLADVLSADPPVYDKSWESWGLYANGAYTIGKLTILPGIRHDVTGFAGDNTSYTLGATYRLTDSTTLRAYTAQGYSLPRAESHNPLQKVKTVQGGVETGAVPYLWLKGTYFFNALRNSGGDMLTLTTSNQDRQGFEVEARTTPLFGVSLASGYTYLYARDIDTGNRLKTNSDHTVPPHNVKLALKYDNSGLGLLGTLTGNYVWWNGATGYPVSDKGMLWDLNLNWKLSPKKGLSPELFFTGHNLFNGNQTVDTNLYNSAGRWFEGGVRVRF